MHKLVKFFKSKKYLKTPKKKKYLILDNSQSFVFKRYLNDDEANIMDTRYESINLFILLKTILKLKFSFNSYIIEYIKSTECEIIISFIDNKIFYYEIKKFLPEKKVVLIQNGMRPELFFKKLSEYKNLKVDYLFTFSDFYTSQYKKYIDGKFITIGSFKNNLIRKKNDTKNNSVLFISSGPLSKKNMDIFQKTNLKSRDYFSPEKSLIPTILNYSTKNNLDFKILARSKSDKNFEYEKKFYQETIPRTNFDFISTFEWDKCYKIIDNSKLVVSIYSALGLESIARGNRTVIFNIRDKITKTGSLKLFWSNNKLDAKGPFWTDEITKNEVERVLEFALTSSDLEWKKSLNTVIPFIIKYEQENESFKKILKTLEKTLDD